MKKKLIIPVFFKAPHGGLHEYVLSSVRMAISQNLAVGVVCPDGEFLNDRLSGIIVEKFPIDYDNPDDCQRAVEYCMTADLIHCHPGPSRKIAVEASIRANIPLVMTVHGRWTDSIYDYHKELCKIICVSEAVADAVRIYKIDVERKINIIPNGVNIDRNISLNNNSPICNFNPNNLNIVVVSRYDVDKKVLVDIVIGLMREQRLRRERNISWYIIGDGTLLCELKNEAKMLNELFTSPIVDFSGWLPEELILPHISESDICIASGRGAIQSLSVGKPTIAAASVGHEVVFRIEDFARAAYSNFGGVGSNPDYCLPEIFDQLLGVNRCNPVFTEQSMEFVAKHYDQRSVDLQLMDVYRAALIEYDKI